MTTAEMNTETRTARALIDARLEAVEQALIGRISRAERLDIVGEVESRIDELLHERCGPGTEPTRADVLAVLMKIDPPEAYLDFESGDEPRPAIAARTARSTRFETGAIDRKRVSTIAALCGGFGILPALAVPGFMLLGESWDSYLILNLGVGACALACMFAGVAAIVLAFVGRSMSVRSVAGAILGTISVMLSLATVYLLIWQWEHAMARSLVAYLPQELPGGMPGASADPLLVPYGRSFVPGAVQSVPIRLH